MHPGVFCLYSITSERDTRFWEMMVLHSNEKRPALLITGTSSGIGEACALELFRRGFRVFAGVRKEADGQRLRQRTDDSLVPVILDVTDANTIYDAVKQVEASVGEAGLAGLVNNAGIIVPGPLELLSTEHFRRQLEVNLLGTHAVTRAFLPLVMAVPSRSWMKLASILQPVRAVL